MIDRVSSLALDLVAERAALQHVLDRLPYDRWDTATPAEGYDVRDQVWHLGWYDGAARRALTDPEAFDLESTRAVADMRAYDQGVVAQGRSLEAADVGRAWAKEAAALDASVAAPGAPDRIRWYMTSMSVASLLSARVMETWAHGQDVRDAVGQQPEVTDRLAHVAHLGCITRAYAFEVNGLPVPQAPVRVELALPSGSEFAHGPEDADDRVTGEAVDFCLVVTQRRHLDDVSLTIAGETARRWLPIAQAFAGVAGQGREPGQFPPRLVRQP